MEIFHLSLAFMKYSDPKLDDFATNVDTKLTENAALFPDLPVKPGVLSTAQSEFHDSLAVSKNAGKAATANKAAKREALVALLRQLALFIQGMPGLSPADAAKSGFEVILGGSRPPVTVESPIILSISNVASTKLGVKVKPPKSYKSLEFSGTVGNGAAVRLGTFPSTRGIVLEPLVPGTTYSIQCRAVFGNKRYSEWSDPVTHMCT